MKVNLKTKLGRTPLGQSLPFLGNNSNSARMPLNFNLKRWLKTAAIAAGIILAVAFAIRLLRSLSHIEED